MVLSNESNDWLQDLAAAAPEDTYEDGGTSPPVSDADVTTPSHILPSLSSTQKTALDYVRRGFVPIKSPRGSKGNFEKGWNDKRYTSEAEVIAEFAGEPSNKNARRVTSFLFL